MNKAASKFAEVTALNGVKICHRSLGESPKKLAVPALVMHGRYDPLIPVESGRDLAGLIPGARLVEYDGGHNLGNDDTVRGLIEAAIVEHIALYN